MDPLRVIAGSSGFFTRAEARSAGHDDRSVSAHLRHGVWHRIRRGAYTFADLWASLDPVGRHRLRACAVVRSLGDAVALSHVSGALEHGLSVWNIPLGRVHVTRLDKGGGRIEGDVGHHVGRAVDEDVVSVNGLRVLRAERCALESGLLTTPEGALCVLDSGLFIGAFTAKELMERHDVLQAWPDMARLRIPVLMADGRSQSVGETRGRWLFRAFSLPAPDLQIEVRDVDGTLLGICDWAWPGDGPYGEFDGKVKYGRLLRPGQDPGDAVFEEKRREDRIREVSGRAMVRLIWSDYEEPNQALTAQRIERLLRRAG